MRVSVIQMNAGADKAANIAQAARLIDAAITADRPDMIALPETWSSMGGERASRFANAETLPAPGSNDAGGPAYEFLRSLARSRKVIVHGGSMTETGGEKLFNTSVVFGRDGTELARYRKIHLFDIIRPDGRGFMESNSFHAGADIVTFTAEGMTIGCAICYDLRFAELFLALRRAGAELIILPSAFTMPTGRDHWDILVRARAIETQCWIAAPALFGRHLEGSRGAPRLSYGHSMIADPWGGVAAEVADGIGWASARIDPATTARIRRDMPVFAQGVQDHRVLA